MPDKLTNDRHRFLLFYIPVFYLNSQVPVSLLYVPALLALYNASRLSSSGSEFSSKFVLSPSKITVGRLTHKANASSPITVTLAGIVMLERLLPDYCNTPPPMPILPLISPLHEYPAFNFVNNIVH